MFYLFIYLLTYSLTYKVVDRKFIGFGKYFVPQWKSLEECGHSLSNHKPSYIPTDVIKGKGNILLGDKTLKGVWFTGD